MAVPQKPFPASFPNWDSLTPATRDQLHLSKEQFDQIRASMTEREARVPAVGSPAPDFELQRLDEKGALTGDILRLSSLLGQPVALVFGSYT